MKSKIFPLIASVLLTSLLLSACGALPGAPGAAPTETPLPVVAIDAQIVAEGNIVPKESATLAFFTSGQVAEVLVDEGDQVKAGEVVARLGDREQLEAAIAAAEAELTAARQARKQLDDNLTLAQADAAAAMSAANKILKDAQYALDNFTVPQNLKGTTPLEAVAAMKARLNRQRDAFEPYRYWESGNETRKKKKEDLDTAQSDYNTAVRWLQLETNLHAAETRLDKSMEDYQNLQEGPDADALESVKARISAAEANLVAANANLKNLELKATINGTVVKNDLIVGQTVTPGAPVLTIADFSELYAETDDLTEIEVVDVALGQPVNIAADSLPDLEFKGEVTKISDISEVKRGDITYTVRIKLDETDPRLRWGMTVVITFLTE
ncbi:MAG: efflux RND transporter periplasmic adaptor subunit [Anaerolineae bacterium]|jgi:multidrug efflux pump subunit AcrA (membrane-fusion protein)|nr:efflux RND transporter periplasmic adaptor subunit [Anaerolineae bacterium]MCZ7553706.1 efflux RND transporter periplasmic adaptor subunit [Anaerolineales bacterium]